MTDARLADRTLELAPGGHHPHSRYGAAGWRFGHRRIGVLARGAACADARHGKTALTAYFVGRRAELATGIRVALSAALMHVLSGFAVFLALRFAIGSIPSMTRRGSPAFAAAGYTLIMVAGGMMLFQRVRPGKDTHGAQALTAGIGLLPCPLTISVLGFAWAQSNAPMIALVLLSLALGIAVTIGVVAVLAILARDRLGEALARRLPELERGARVLQGIAGAAVIAIGLFTLATLLS
jgi:ABC-type nickel/cobalt efflux system permease component RcnA